MPRMRRHSPWPGPSMASTLKPRRANSRPAKKMLISFALSMPSTITTVGAGPVTPAPFHEQRRQGDALVGHLDELDVRIPHPDAGVIAAVSAPAPGALLLAREDEALGVVEII